MAIGERDVPERLLRDLIVQMGPAELSDWRLDIDRIINEFQKKRRKNLLKILDSRKPEYFSSSQSTAGAAWPQESPSISLTSPLVMQFRDALDELHQHHIFQWSTFYRDCFDLYFGRFLDSMEHPSLDEFVKGLTDPLADHTHAVFSQGYAYVRRTHNYDDAINKSLNGLSHFLGLPLDYYSSQASGVSDYRSTVSLRLLFSAALCGILEGYSRVQFDAQTGSGVLARFQRRWAHYVAFLTPQHAECIIDCVEPGPFASGLKLSALPLLDALQRFFRSEDEYYWPIPVMGQYSWPQRRLDISIRPPRNAAFQGLIETRAYLDESFVHIEDLDSAFGRRVVLVIAPLKPDMQKVVNDRERLNAITVPVHRALSDSEDSARSSRAYAAERAFTVLDDAVYALRSKLEAKSPITYNFAREFPLHHPDKASFFHVTRTSVRDLLRTFERRNGVRLWCSVRRSGKTTACFDMETTTGDSVIVGQTCGVPPTADAGMFYERVRNALASGGMVSSGFVKDIISECAPVNIDGRRTVLIIDEYETLFGLLRNAVKGNSVIRYNVVQPLLDQLVTLAQDNLLVFLGQQPDAHFILMDQNQLAPYVTQDSFPLFEHVQGAATGEFSKLVNKILFGRIECTATFMDALYKETGGHPFLTANVLIDFVDWLIEKRRPQSGLRLQKADFTRFSRAKLTANEILLSPEYNFFKQAAASALSEQGYRDNPWLFAAYWVLRELSGDISNAFRVSRTDFQETSSRIPVPAGERTPDCSEVLRTASQANFLSYDDRNVNVRIRTLGRIAAAVRPAIS